MLLRGRLLLGRRSILEHSHEGRQHPITTSSGTSGSSSQPAATATAGGTRCRLGSPVDVLNRNLLAPFKRCERLGGAVGHDVAADAVHVELAADGADLHAEVIGDLDGLEPAARVDDARRERRLAGGVGGRAGAAAAGE